MNYLVDKVLQWNVIHNVNLSPHQSKKQLTKNYIQNVNSLSYLGCTGYQYAAKPKNTVFKIFFSSIKRCSLWCSKVAAISIPSSSSSIISPLDSNLRAPPRMRCRHYLIPS